MDSANLVNVFNIVNIVIIGNNDNNDLKIPQIFEIQDFFEIQELIFQGIVKIS